MEQKIKSSEGIDVDQIGSQVTITINRPDVMNAMTTQMFADFGRICREISRSESVRVVVTVSYTHLTLPTICSV